eukprot:TRINITY_DN5841_c0_g2_i1.p1 TRINITY_DN5841_c0_g2~~TRINITY_DN5841_c0_g2_i1.p1  ORF type:complete len:525 (+),score=120.70 TRINITY_DN5841_c0_g2_i1:35-1609(+)
MSMTSSMKRQRVAYEATPEEFLVATWNLAAINNNPFEYWITHSDADGAYDELMKAVEELIENPGEDDITVAKVLGKDQFEELLEMMGREGWEGDKVKLKQIWNDDLSARKIISGFLKDKTLGEKRLISMPERKTNTIDLPNGGVAYRPSVINNFQEELPSVEKWWGLWKSFMFEDLVLPSKETGAQRIRPCNLLRPLERSKYPVTEDEAKVSVGLQCLCLAIFDAILVHMMNRLSRDGQWMEIKKSIFNALYCDKNKSSISILKDYCGDHHVICLQETSLKFLDDLGKVVGASHHVVAPVNADPGRAQNSALLLCQKMFPAGVEKELTHEVRAALDGSSSIDDGDLIVVSACAASGKKFILASFHGDTNGKVTAPVVRAVNKIWESEDESCRLLFGMDANTYLKGTDKLYGVKKFLEDCHSLDLKASWEKGMEECLTTCKARTYLQPQLNKAVASSEKLQKGDVNPKDHIVFKASHFEAISTFKDNTGRRQYKEATCFPSLEFPSDHGIVATVLRSKGKGKGKA